MPQNLTSTVPAESVTPQNILQGADLFSKYEPAVVATLVKLYPQNALIQEIAAISPNLLAILPEVEAFLATVLPSQS